MNPPSPHFPRRPGFTLVEILATMTIMVAVLSIVAAGHFAWKRASALPAAAAQCDALFAYARQRALSSSSPVLVVACNGAPDIDPTNAVVAIPFVSSPPSGDRACLFASAVDPAAPESIDDASVPHRLVADIVSTPRNMTWHDSGDSAPAAYHFVFLPDGTCRDPARDEDDSSDIVFCLVDSTRKSAPVRRYFSLSPATSIVRDSDADPDAERKIVP